MDWTSGKEEEEEEEEGEGEREVRLLLSVLRRCNYGVCSSSNTAINLRGAAVQTIYALGRGAVTQQSTRGDARLCY